MIFSKRTALAERAVEWCEGRKISVLHPVNIVTALAELGELKGIDEPAKSAVNVGPDYDPIPLHDVRVGDEYKRLTYYRRRLEPTYRPFATAEEFKPHRDRWIRDNKVPGWFTTIASFNDVHVWLNGASVGISYAELFARHRFDDDGEPCGVKL